MTALRQRRATGIAVLVLVAVVAVLLPGCTGGSSKGYQVTAYFTRAVGLYEGSTVKVLGLPAGKVDRITIEDSRVRVDMRIRPNVPLPTGVGASINSLTIIGERTIMLGPAWRPGDELAPDGFTIPVERTKTPVEPDDALQAFKDLADAIDPATLTGMVSAAANAFGGDPAAFNDLLGASSRITSNVAEQDDRIIEIATGLHELASLLNSREAQLGAIIDGFSEATGTLAGERDAIASLLANSVRLVDAGASLVTAYQGTLPEDLARIVHLGRAVEANVDVFSQLFATLPELLGGLFNAYDPTLKVFKVNANVVPTIANLLDASLGRILDELGLGDLLCLLPLIGRQC